MMPLEPVTLSFGAALLLGLSFGSGPCNIACMPYLGPVFVATGNGIRQAWRTVLPFTLGRMTGYALLAAAAGWAGVLVEDWIDAPWVRWLLGAATILVALSLLWRRRKPVACSQSLKPQPSVPATALGKPSPALPGSLFCMGMGMALNPCAPLSTVILAAATTASITAGLSLGLGFALGAVAVPTLIFTFGVAHFGAQLKEHMGRWRNALENTSVGLLMLMGAATAMGWIAP
ncbi:MAG: sulfite exporter TauE/SafE family protein [Candidatus Sedimenticola sp. 20ELBAFRAG]